MTVTSAVTEGTLALTDRGPILVAANMRRDHLEYALQILGEWWERGRGPLVIGGIGVGSIVDLRHHASPHPYRTPAVVRGPRFRTHPRRLAGYRYIASLRS